MLVVCGWLIVFGCWLIAVCCSLLLVSRGLFVFGCWLFAASRIVVLVFVFVVVFVVVVVAALSLSLHSKGQNPKRLLCTRRCREP